MKVAIVFISACLDCPFAFHQYNEDGDFELAICKKQSHEPVVPEFGILDSCPLPDKDVVIGGMSD